MNSLQRKALHQAGLELLSGNLDPVCYANVLSEADGHPQKALGIYAQKRATELQGEFLKMTNRELQRVKNMGLQKCPRIRPKVEDDLFRPAMLIFIMFLGSTGALMSVCGSFTGQICGNSILKILLTSSLITTGCFIASISLRRFLPRVSYHKLMMPFAAALAFCSLATACLNVKNQKEISWASHSHLSGK